MYASRRIVNGLMDDLDHYGTIRHNPIWIGGPNLKLIIGLQLARLADLPEDALTHAGKIASDLSDESARGHKSSESCKVARRRKAVLKVCCGTWKRLRTFFDISNFDLYHELPDENNVDPGF
jgi:hypothetical protein